MTLNKFTIQTNFAISAGAGSGKTYTLSRRYINALLGFDYNRRKN
jgi:ATP-dependent exoDNAse (exonuclease V) beta subunit